MIFEVLGGEGGSFWGQEKGRFVALCEECFFYSRERERWHQTELNKRREKEEREGAVKCEGGVHWGL